MAEDSVDAGGLQGSLGIGELPGYSGGTSAQPPERAARPTVAATAAAPAISAKPDAAGPADLQAAVARANANLASSNRVLDYRVDPATGLTIAMIRNSQTGAIMQEIPGADVIALAHMLADWSPGKHILLDLIA